MAKLTTKKRETLPKSKLGEPDEKAYPMPAAAHAKIAKVRVSQVKNARPMSAAEDKKIDAEA